MTNTIPTTIEVQLDAFVLTMRPFDGDHDAVLAAIAEVTDGHRVEWATGPDTVRAAPSTLTAIWHSYLVHVAGVPGLDDHVFEREDTPIAQRLRALDQRGVNEARRLLELLGNRVTAPMLRDFVNGATATVPPPTVITVGDFVGLDCWAVSSGGQEWAVDPATGRVSGLLAAAVPA